MKKVVALLMAIPRLAWADTSPAEPTWGDEALGALIDSSLSSTPREPLVAAPVDEVKPVAEEATPRSAPLSYGAEVDVSSRYVWRGLAFSEYPVLQPSARVSDYGATLALASNAYLGTEVGVNDRLSELDLIGNYTFTLGAASFTPSIGAYFFAEAPATSELGATLAYDLSLFVIETRQALDIADNAGGWFADVAALRSQQFGSRVRLDAITSLGWCSGSFGRYYIDESISGLHWGAAQLDASLVVTATDALYVRVHGTASHILEQYMRELTPEANLLSGGLALGFAH